MNSYAALFNSRIKRFSEKKALFASLLSIFFFDDFLVFLAIRDLSEISSGEGNGVESGGGSSFFSAIEKGKGQKKGSDLSIYLIQI